MRFGAAIRDVASNAAAVNDLSLTISFHTARAAQILHETSNYSAKAAIEKRERKYKS